MKKLIVKSEYKSKKNLKPSINRHMGDAIHHVSHAAQYMTFHHGGSSDHKHVKTLKKIKSLLHKMKTSYHDDEGSK